MIKNRTSQFKSKYSNSESKHSSKRQITPQYLKTKLALTGFTNTTETTNIQKKTTKKIAKVESTAFLKSRTKLQNTPDEPQPASKKLIENQTSLCRYLKNKAITLENHFPQRYRKILEESQISQKTANMSQSSQLSQVKRTLIQIKQVLNVEKFFTSLTPRSLFFCCKCFRYVFAIEKNLHYPNCESEVDSSEMDKKQQEMIAWQKMNMIVELSQYTKNKTAQIEKLLQLAKRSKLAEQYDVQISANVTYLNFDEIIEAFFYTYEKLLRDNALNNPSSIFSMKKIFSCVQAKHFESNLFEKKFFG